MRSLPPLLALALLVSCELDLGLDTGPPPRRQVIDLAVQGTVSDGLQPITHATVEFLEEQKFGLFEISIYYTVRDSLSADSLGAYRFTARGLSHVVGGVCPFMVRALAPGYHAVERQYAPRLRCTSEPQRRDLILSPAK